MHVMCSSIFSFCRKRQAELFLQRSGLDYTIVRPAGLTSSRGEVCLWIVLVVVLNYFMFRTTEIWIMYDWNVVWIYQSIYRQRGGMQIYLNLRNITLCLISWNPRELSFCFFSLFKVFISLLVITFPSHITSFNIKVEH